MPELAASGKVRAAPLTNKAKANPFSNKGLRCGLGC
jgi:hypothetical protein